MLLGPLVDGVEQQVGIKQHQLLAGPSSVSSVSAMLSKSTPRPRSWDFWRNGARGFSWAASPARTSSLTASLTPIERSRRSRSTAAATSSARVKVVRTGQAYHIKMRLIEHQDADFLL